MYFTTGLTLACPCFLSSRRRGNPTPKVCFLISNGLAELYGLPVVFILQYGLTYERQLLMDKGVYFVMSNQYAYLPMLVAPEKYSNRIPAKTLSPVAQYLMLFHLQVKSIKGLFARGIAPVVPYSYENVTLGITCLTDVGLVEKIKTGQRNQVIHFMEKGRRTV